MRVSRDKGEGKREKARSKAKAKGPSASPSGGGSNPAPQPTLFAVRGRPFLATSSHFGRHPARPPDVSAAAIRARAAREEGGTLLPSLCSPLLFFVQRIDFPDRALKPDAAKLFRAGLALGVRRAQHSPVAVARKASVTQSARGSPRPSRLFWRYSIRAQRQKG